MMIPARFRAAAGVAAAMLSSACATISPPDIPVPLPVPPGSSIAAPSLRPFVDGRTWVLERELEVRLDGRDIRVPAGFVTDLASIPGLAERIRSRVGTYNRAAIVHDWLYWTGLCSREEADRIFLKAMRTSGTSERVARQIYRAVQVGGWVAFDDNARLRAAEEAAAGGGDRRLIDLTSSAGFPHPLLAVDTYHWPSPTDPVRQEFLRRIRLLPSPGQPPRADWCTVGVDPLQTQTPRAYRPRRR